jgi:hypothetical protein
MNNKFKKLGDRPDQKIDRIKKLKKSSYLHYPVYPLWGCGAEPRAVSSVSKLEAFFVPTVNNWVVIRWI